MPASNAPALTLIGGGKLAGDGGAMMVSVFAARNVGTCGAQHDSTL